MAPVQELQPSTGENPESSISPDRFRPCLAAGLVAIPLFCIWCYGELTRSLWLDEFVTYWVVEDGFQNVAARTFEYQAQSPVYYWLVSLSTMGLGSSEFGLRLPSFILSCWGLVMVYLSTRHYCGTRAAIAASVVYFLSVVCNPGIAFNARPYSLSICSLVTAVWFALRLGESPRFRHCIGLAISSVLIVYSHYLLAPAVIVPAVVLLSRTKLTRRYRCLVGTSIAITLLLSMMPLIGHLRTLAARSQLYQVAGRGTLLEVALDIFDAELASVVFAITVTLLLFERNVFTRRIPWGGILAAGMWYAIPPLLSYGLQLLDILMYVGRYLVWQLPALAYMSALAAKNMQRGFSVIVMTSIAGAGLCSGMLIFPQRENWRSAVEWSQSRHQGERVFMLYSGLIESRSIEWLTNDERSSYLTTSLRYYGVRSRVLPLPFYFPDAISQTFLARLRGSLSQTREVFVIIRLLDFVDDEGLTTSSGDMVIAYMDSVGFRVSDSAECGAVTVLHFVRVRESPDSRQAEHPGPAPLTPKQRLAPENSVWMQP